MATLTDHGGVAVLVYPNGGPNLDVAAATDLIGEALSTRADWVLIPAACLGDEFFWLRTGVAGEICQKFANYRTGLAIVGDISGYVAASTPLRDFVAESNRRGHLWFVDTESEFDERLSLSNGSW